MASFKGLHLVCQRRSQSMMSTAEDAASVLEEFIHDVANLPAEIAHLWEEIEAKDKAIMECKQIIAKGDLSLQKHVKVNSCRLPHPKEEQYIKTVLANYDKAQAIQTEKEALADKAAHVLDRRVKRLDKQIKDLTNQGVMAPDPLLPSLLKDTPGNQHPALSVTTTGASTPLNPIPGNASVPSHPISASLNRLLPHGVPTPRQPSPNQGNPAPSNSSSTRGTRESSTDAAKRRRLNPPSALRQSSLGPGTPKALTPNTPDPGTIRAGSAGPRSSFNKKLPGKKIAPHQRVGHLNPASAAATATLKKGGSLAARRRALKKGSGLKPSLSETSDQSLGSDGDDGSERGTIHVRRDDAALRDSSGGAGPGALAGLTERAGRGRAQPVQQVQQDNANREDDDKLYCFCQNVSHGDMIGCDNVPYCRYEWFHWKCVGLTGAPKGKWFCSECRERLGLR